MDLEQDKYNDWKLLAICTMLVGFSISGIEPSLLDFRPNSHYFGYFCRASRTQPIKGTEQGAQFVSWSVPQDRHRSLLFVSVTPNIPSKRTHVLQGL